MNLIDTLPDCRDDKTQALPDGQPVFFLAKESKMNETPRLVLCTVDAVDPELPFRCEHNGMAYAVFQLGDTYYVTADLCTHGPGSLSEGELEGCEVICPFHQGRFDIRTGAAVSAPCTHALRTWTAHVVDGRIEIDPREIR